MAGVELPQGVTIRGRDITPLLRAVPIDRDDELYLEYSMHHGATTHMRGYRTLRWKLMRDFANPGRAELYDLKNDPRESTNLIHSTDPLHVRVREELYRKILRHLGAICLVIRADIVAEGRSGCIQGNHHILRFFLLKDPVEHADKSVDCIGGSSPGGA